VRIAFLTDIHEDAVSLKKALRLIEREKCDQVVCLGDILGFPYLRGKYESTRDVHECISLVRQHCSLVVAGNHDLFHLRKFPKYAAGFRFPGNWYELSPQEKTLVGGHKVWSYADDYPVMLDDNELEFLNKLPEYSFMLIGGYKVLVSHYVYPNFTGYMLSGRNEKKKILEHFHFMQQNDCDLSICGHMHIEGIGLHYVPAEGVLSKFFNGYDYYSFGTKRLKNKNCSISIPALADNGQVNGFAIFDTADYSINAVSLNTNRRFIL
jgi:predicted phosphodiesterase